MSEGEKWRETRRFALRVLRDFGVGRNIMEDSIRQEGHQIIQYMQALAKEGDGYLRDHLAPFRRRCE